MSNPIYQLGEIVFRVSADESSFTASVTQLFPPALQSDTPVLNYPMKDVRSIITDILSRHSYCIWLDAACLLSPSGRLILISGLSGVGKSTTAMALVFGFRFKLFAEDITLIDWQQDRLIPFASPFSAKTGTISLLQDAIGISPPLILNEWLTPPFELIAHQRQAKFDLVLHLVDQPELSRELHWTEIGSAEYVRRILPCSNLIHEDEAPDRMLTYVDSATRRLMVSGGTLKERLDLILDSLH